MDIELSNQRMKMFNKIATTMMPEAVFFSTFINGEEFVLLASVEPMSQELHSKLQKTLNDIAQKYNW